MNFPSSSRLKRIAPFGDLNKLLNCSNHISKNYYKKSLTGFTLIELLVVISVIGLLASVLLVSINGARVKARDTKRVADISQIQKAMELYYANNG
jgi:prepilin-type N-terminal cleavage/methylation domain-containing protein